MKETEGEKGESGVGMVKCMIHLYEKLFMKPITIYTEHKPLKSLYEDWKL